MKSKYIDEYGIDSLPHLILASQTGMDVFLTLNESILEDREELEEKFGIKIECPNDLKEVKESG